MGAGTLARSSPRVAGEALVLRLAAVVAAAMIALAVTIGLLTGRDVFAETPMAALRES